MATGESGVSGRRTNGISPAQPAPALPRGNKWRNKNHLIAEGDIIVRKGNDISKDCDCSSQRKMRAVTRRTPKTCGVVLERPTNRLSLLTAVLQRGMDNTNPRETFLILRCPSSRVPSSCAEEGWGAEPLSRKVFSYPSPPHPHLTPILPQP